MANELRRKFSEYILSTPLFREYNRQNNVLKNQKLLKIQQFFE